jgi:hypothetical protein
VQAHILFRRILSISFQLVYLEGVKMEPAKAASLMDDNYNMFVCPNIE